MRHTTTIWQFETRVTFTRNRIRRRADLRTIGLRSSPMVRIAIAALAAITLIGAASALAGNLPRAPAKPSSFAPQPYSGPHVYGAPIGAPTVGSAAVRRKHASPKHPAKAAARHVKAAAPKRPPPPAYAAPDPS